MDGDAQLAAELDAAEVKTEEDSLERVLAEVRARFAAMDAGTLARHTGQGLLRTLIGWAEKADLGDARGLVLHEFNTRLREWSEP
jgi:hypothetical protein